MSPTKKIRADQLLVNRGLAPTRTKAQAFIMSGNVFLQTQRIDKSSQLLPEDSKLTLKGKEHPYVSRGGLKLKAAIDHFKIDVRNKIALDIGASTGGFTDCLLQEGAKKVIALDVGHGQLDMKLRNDPRVEVIERCNFRTLDLQMIKDEPEIIVIDVSFISLKLILPKAVDILKRGNIIALIKPQFEVGKEEADRHKGIIKDEDLQNSVVDSILEFAKKLNLEIQGVITSPILGQEGNKEFLLAASIP